MEQLINKRVKQIQVSEIRKFSELAATYPDSISFAIGQPDFATPDHIKESGKRAIDDNRTVYTTNAGLIELRRAAAQFISTKYGLDYNPDNEIIVTSGASEALDIAFRTILDEDSEVLLPGPVYPGYEPILTLCGAKISYYDISKTNFKVDPAVLAAAITPQTRCVVIPSSNPTGIALNRDDLAQIAAVLKDKNIFILSDEIYSELTYGHTHCSIASFPELRNKTIVINGLSKSHSMTGWRIGLTFAPAYLTKQMVKVHQYNATCACSISQEAAIQALTVGINDAEPMIEQYVKRRDYAYRRLLEMGFDVLMPNGAFYLFPSITTFHPSSYDFAADLLDKARVAVVPGTAFTSYGEGYIRISYACSMETLTEGLNRMDTYLQKRA